MFRKKCIATVLSPVISEVLQVDIFSFTLQPAALWLLMTHFQQTVTLVGLELDGVGVMRGGRVSRGVGVNRRYPRRREMRGGAFLMED